LAGTINVLKTSERLCIHGNQDVIPTEYDGLIQQIKKAPIDRRNIQDARGKTLLNIGENIFAETARQIHEYGGEANKIFFTPVLSDDIQALCRDRIRFGTDDNRMTSVFDRYPTPFGDLRFGIKDYAGPNKMFFAKGRVVSKGDALRKPNKPTFTVSSAPVSGSKFLNADGGNYIYQVFAVNNRGISEADTSAAVAVAGGDGVLITITNSTNIPGTGFVICRSSVNGDDPMEMIRIPATPGGVTTYTDLNEDLPGTTDMIIITEKKFQVVGEFYQLNPMRLYRMNPVNRLVSPFILALWGIIDLKVPEWSALVKNVQYKGGIKYA
jgi:hypothetical protein